MKIVTISDTHGQHAKLVLPKGDMLLHAGDVSSRGDRHEIESFLHWFGRQPHQHKIFIAGNHDFFFERESDELIQSLIPPGVVYLKDSGTIIDGINIWGSPITPWFLNWAFNRYPGDEINAHWNLIPNDTDILITHGPVFRTLDQNHEGLHIGCKDLLVKVQQIKPKVHVFGHIHESYGTVDKLKTKFINASVLNENYKLVNAPIVFDL